MHDRFERSPFPGRLLFRVKRPLVYTEVLRRHLAPALIAGLVLLIACYLPLEKVPLRICVFRGLTGYPCPTCGWTRGFFAAARGEWGAVLSDCPFAIFLYISVVIVFLWNTAGILLGLEIARGPALKMSLRKWLCATGLLFMLVAANWVYRLVMGFD